MDVMAGRRAERQTACRAVPHRLSANHFEIETMTDDSLRLRRSVLYVPAANARAIDKSAALPCDAIVFDLEDAVSPAMKSAARAQLGQALSGRRSAGQEIVLRVNALGTAEFAQDLMLAASARVDAVLLPKVGDDSDVVTFARACAALAWDKPPALWAMVETPQAIHRLDAIVAAGRAATPRLDCLVIGTNDLAKDTGVFAGEERRYLMPWLMQAVLAAKRYGVDILDGVWNDFGDQAGYAAELTQSVRMAFDGKTLIHPSQIDAANAAFGPSAQQVAEAERIAAAFAANENADAGVINLDGRMVERLHLEQALRLLARHRAIVQAEQRRGGAAATATAANAPNSPNAANAANAAKV